jgi:hypothetical protein
MVRQILEEHLAIAEVHIFIGEQCLLRQREIVSELEREGHDAPYERELLAQYEIMQAMRLQDFERLRSGLHAAQFSSGVNSSE